MKVTTSEQEIAAAQSMFASSIRTLARDSDVVSIGFQSGHFDTRVSWLPDLGYWAYFGSPPSEKSLGERFWNVFGLGRPTGSVSIACEINPPLRGINRQAAGVFLRDSSGRIHVGHRGILNARGRIELEFVFANFRGIIRQVDDAGRSKRVLYVGELGDPRFPELLRDFIMEVARVKELARAKRGG